MNPCPRPALRLGWFLSLALALAFPGCTRAPAVPSRPASEVLDPGWFGEGARLVPEGAGLHLWARPGLALRGQAVAVAPLEVPQGPPGGKPATERWCARRDRVARLYQAQLADGLALVQEVPPPAGTPPAFRVHARLLAFDRETRVAAKAGQVAGNLLLMPYNLAMVAFVISGGSGEPRAIEGVSGYRTEALVQVKVVEVATGATVLGLQVQEDFRSLEVPLRLPDTLWRRAGPASTGAAWEAGLPEPRERERAWFKPQLDLRGKAIRCLPWLPGATLGFASPERELLEGLPSLRLPRRLVQAPALEGGPALRLDGGALYLQGELGAPDRPFCRVRLWDPATGETLGLIRAPWDADRSWVERIRKHLQAQRGGS